MPTQTMWSEYVKESTTGGALHYTTNAAILVVPARPYSQSGWIMTMATPRLIAQITLALPAPDARAGDTHATAR